MNPRRTNTLITVLFSTGLLLASLSPQAASASFVSTGTMNAPRGRFTATLLTNGQVLVAGGTADRDPSPTGTYLSSAELYNPNAGTWTTITAMTAERSDHTATLLPDGKVLVVGGITKGVKSILASAEVYDPSTGRWTLVGKLAKGRAFHTATLLPNGTVLVAGGMAVGAKVISTAELYDPATKLWTTTGAMRNARGVPTATLLANGEVLVTGGYVGLYPSGNAVASAEIYNPITGAWKVAGACPKMVGF